MAAIYFLPPTLMFQEMDRQDSVGATDAPYLIDARTGAMTAAEEQRPVTTEMIAAWASVRIPVRDEIGRTLITIGGVQYTDDGENVQPVRRTKNSAHSQPATDYGA